MTNHAFFVESLLFVLNHEVPKSLPPLSEMITMFEAIKEEKEGAWIDNEPKGDQTPDLAQIWQEQVAKRDNGDDE